MNCNSDSKTLNLMFTFIEKCFFHSQFGKCPKLYIKDVQNVRHLSLKNFLNRTNENSAGPLVWLFLLNYVEHYFKQKIIMW